jgi:hypothetical protein
MNFLVNLSNNNVPVSRIINANSWSACLAYCEGTEFQINSITQLSSNVIIVLNEPTSQNCYNVNLKSNSTGTIFVYYVFVTDFNSLETWLAEQTDTTVTTIQLSQKSYVTV